MAIIEELTGFKNKPGSAIQDLLSRHGIKQKVNGCKCQDVRTKMDAMGTEGCRNNFKHIRESVLGSVNEWRNSLGIVEYITTTPKLITVLVEVGHVGIPLTLRDAVSILVTWAIKKSEE
jgi:hypothetical protein